MRYEVSPTVAEHRKSRPPFLSIETVTQMVCMCSSRGKRSLLNFAKGHGSTRARCAWPLGRGGEVIIEGKQAVVAKEYIGPPIVLLLHEQLINKSQPSDPTKQVWSRPVAEWTLLPCWRSAPGQWGPPKRRSCSAQSCTTFAAKHS